MPEASRDFLQLWHHTTADWNLSEGRVLGHSGSNQFHRVQPGDTVWVVTVYPSDELVLLGRVRVAVRTDLEGARRRLGTDDVWEAKYHVIAEPGTEEPLREVDLTDMAGELRFVSKVNDRLDLRDGRVNAQQLQTMRRLTPKSVAMLEERWSGNPGSTPGTDIPPEFERFVWREGDLETIYDPYEERRKRKSTSLEGTQTKPEGRDPRQHT